MMSREKMLHASVRRYESTLLKSNQATRARLVTALRQHGGKPVGPLWVGSCDACANARCATDVQK